MRSTLTIEVRPRHHHRANLFHVSLNLPLSGKEIVVSRDPERTYVHFDEYVALRNACDATRKQREAPDQGSGKGAPHSRHPLEGSPPQGEPL